MLRRTTAPAAMRGVTLLEAMLALSLLLIGIVGLVRLQVIGVTANQGARAMGQAQTLARELAAALQRLDPTQDALLQPNVTSASPPSGFGQPLDSSGNLATTSWRDWNDSYLTSTTTSFPALKVVGVRPDTELERDPLDATKPLYRRRWSVWQIQTANAQSGVRLLAVSVVWRERSLPQPRSITVYAQMPNLGASTVNASAYR